MYEYISLINVEPLRRKVINYYYYYYCLLSLACFGAAVAEKLA